MLQFGAIQSMLKSENFNQGNTAKLKSGQIFQGKIVKFHPNNIAQVQLGGLSIHAKLEAALAANVRYWFQVQPNESIVELKVIDTPNPSGSEQGKGQAAKSIQELLKSFGLSNTKLNQELVKTLIQKELPFTHSNLSQATQLLKGNTSHEKALNAIETIVRKDLPFTKSVFDSLVAVQKSETFAKEINDVLRQLNSLEKPSSTVQQLKEVLGNLSNSVTNKQQSSDLMSLLKKWTESVNGSPEHRSFQSIFDKIGLENLSKMNDKEIKAAINNIIKVLELPNEQKSLLSTQSQTNQISTRDVMKQLLNLVPKEQSIEQNKMLENILKEFSKANLTNIRGKLSQLMSENEDSKHQRLETPLNSKDFIKMLSNDERVFLQRYVNQTDSKEQQILSLVKKWAESTPRTQENRNAQLVLTKAGYFPKDLDEPQFFQKMNNLLEEMKIPNEAKGDQKVSGSIQSMINQALKFIDEAPLLYQKQESIQQLLKLFHSNENLQTLTKQEQQILSSVQDNWANGQETAKAFKTILSSIGIQYEHELFKAITDEKQVNAEQLKSLKSLLIRALNESLPATIQERLEPLLNRISGQQLIASEQSGPFQQLLVQIPLTLGQFKTDLTMQWSGKKKQDGQIDPNFCRILFYLELEALKETVVDVHVQNRIVNIQVFNDTPGIEKLMRIAQPMLKEKLSKLDYQLSSVKAVIKEEKAPSKFDQIRFTSNQSYKSNQPYSGVDFKV